MRTPCSISELVIRFVIKMFHSHWIWFPRRDRHGDLGREIPIHVTRGQQEEEEEPKIGEIS